MLQLRCADLACHACIPPPCRTGNRPASIRAMPAGSSVTHFGKQVHWDGAKDEDAVLLIMGEGPATSTDAEEK
jgi:hypothetical protein